MAYTTILKVKSVLAGATGEEGGTADELSDAQINYEINSVKANIDSALRRHYKVPFDAGDTLNDTTGVPQLIVQIATDIAAYGCDLNYRKGREYDNQNMPVPLRYQKAQQLLENLRTGTISLDWPRSDSTTFGAHVFHSYEPALMRPEDVFIRRGYTDFRDDCW